LDGDSIQKVNYTDTDHYQITLRFLNAPERYFKHLFAADCDDGEA
jgi:predicted ATPase